MPWIWNRGKKKRAGDEGGKFLIGSDCAIASFVLNSFSDTLWWWLLHFLRNLGAEALSGQWGEANL